MLFQTSGAFFLFGLHWFLITADVLWLPFPPKGHLLINIFLEHLHINKIKDSWGMDAKITRRGYADDTNLAFLENLSQTLKFH